jgi:2,5-diamino-6-(ribosylamino)-4(3H)-pyrimidinone 5'-phosphate reductase
MTMVVPERKVQPLRCVVSHGGKFDFQHPIFHRAGGPIHLLITGGTAPESHTPPSYSLHHGSILEFLENLATRLNVARLHCEGGGQLIKALAQLDVIDEYHITLAGHTVFGGRDAPTSTGIPEEYLPTSLGFEVVDFQPVLETGECFMSYRRSR